MEADVATVELRHVRPGFAAGNLAHGGLFQSKVGTDRGQALPLRERPRPNPTHVRVSDRRVRVPASSMVGGTAEPRAPSVLSVGPLRHPLQVRRAVVALLAVLVIALVTRRARTVEGRGHDQMHVSARQVRDDEVVPTILATSSRGRTSEVTTRLVIPYSSEIGCAMTSRTPDPLPALSLHRLGV